jgi:hypothetical protein
VDERAERLESVVRADVGNRMLDSKELLFELSSVVGVLCRCIWLRLSYALGVDVSWSRQRATLSGKGGRQV